MSSSDFLRKNLNQHSIKNLLSKTMDSDIDVAVAGVILLLQNAYPELSFRHQKNMMLQEIIALLTRAYPEQAPYFSDTLATSFIKPDGGFLFAKTVTGPERLILVSEVKRQGTNDKRAQEGLAKQAKGNAIERLGKNLIGIKAIFKNEAVLPFVCFGQGHDFLEGSSILDRVVTMNEFFPLNTMYVKKEHHPFEPVSMYFRYEDWSSDEMAEILYAVAVQAIDCIFD